MNELIRHIKRRNFILLTFLIGSIIFLIYRIGYIKHKYGEVYEEKAVLPRLNTVQVIYPHRGFMGDRNFQFSNKYRCIM